MVRYYKTTELYHDVDTLRFDIYYEKGYGYIARLQPCMIHPKYGILGFSYCPEYYKYFGMQTMDLVPSSRRNANREATAIQKALADDVMNILIDHFIAYAESRGRTVTVLGEMEELRK